LGSRVNIRVDLGCASGQQERYEQQGEGYRFHKTIKDRRALVILKLTFIMVHRTFVWKSQKWEEHLSKEIAQRCLEMYRTFVGYGSGYDATGLIVILFLFIG
jgi:hypothetical protein